MQEMNYKTTLAFLQPPQSTIPSCFQPLRSTTALSLIHTHTLSLSHFGILRNLQDSTDYNLPNSSPQTSILSRLQFNPHISDKQSTLLCTLSLFRRSIRKARSVCLSSRTITLQISN